MMLITSIVNAQMYFGVTCDVGNRIDHQTDASSTYFKRPITLSGSLTIQMQEEIHKNWFLRYGITAGVLGYNVKVFMPDTISNSTSLEPYPFLDYTNIFTSLQFDLGRFFDLYERKFSWLIGGGISRYFNMFPDGVIGSVSVVNNNNSLSRIFYYEMYPANKFSAFAEMTVQLELNQRFSTGLSYRYHFKSALKGSFEFDHVEKPSIGTLSVTHRTFSILLLVRMGK